MKKKSTAVIAQIHSLMHENGLTMEDIGAKFGARKIGPGAAGKSASAKPAATAKYADPKSGATWSGHGRAPAWIANAKNREKFLVSGGSSSTTAPVKAAAKPGNYVRGPQPAKYRDPKSGAEWSGRGKAPGWLAGVKDRTKFLIDGAAAVAPAKKGGKSALPATKKTPVKKGAASVAAPKRTAKTPSVKTATTAQTSTQKAPIAEKKAIVSKKVAAKKAAPVAKKSAQAASKKGAVKKVATKKLNGGATVGAVTDSTPVVPNVTSETSAVTAV